MYYIFCLDFLSLYDIIMIQVDRAIAPSYIGEESPSTKEWDGS